MSQIINDFKVIQLNINSIQSKVKRIEFQQFLNKTKPQIVLLSETKLNKRHNVSFNGYRIVRNDRMQNCGGGTAICFSTNIDCEHINTPSNIKSFECCLLKMKLINGKNLIFASVYKPPSEVINKKTVHIKINPMELNSILNIDKNAYYIIGGDFNAHHQFWNDKQNCINGKAIYEWFLAHKNNYNIDLYASENPTCMRSTDGSHIDFGFISSSIEITNSACKTKLSSELYSDHAAITLKINIQPTEKEQIVIKNYKQTNWQRFKAFIELKTNVLNIPVNRNLNKNEIDENIKKLNEIYSEAIEKFVPCIKIINRENILSFHSIKLLKKKKSLLRKKHRNVINTNRLKICDDLRLINEEIFSSIKRDYSQHYETKIKSLFVDNNVFKNIKALSTYKKKLRCRTLYTVIITCQPNTPQLSKKQMH